MNFYGRRARRIIPAGSLVIIVTVVAAFIYLGSLTGHETAIDGQWASLFLANFHFAASETNYLSSQQPPSALQNYWSLAVEEQFYIVYPLIFMVVASLFSRTSLRLRLALALLLGHRRLIHLLGHIHFDERTRRLLLTPYAGMGIGAGRTHCGSQYRPSGAFPVT